MKDETLLSCPFCGGEPEEEGGTFVEYYGHERQDYSITCKQCGAEVHCEVGDFEGADAVCSCHHNTRKICSDKWNRRALQSGNSAQPVTVPAGYVLVPVEPTSEMMMHKSGCQHHAWDDPDCPMRETRRLVWSHMLAAAKKGV
ncbi:Lar family restriction alleviation protein [Citrobacter bitternis]|uniref:Lar family restriction alleviation protein n=1 Tax=Citrobacter bitternis TaxID=1585982 RepID=A0ABW1Q0G9_9ENTR